MSAAPDDADATLEPPPRRRPLGFELVIVTILSTALLLPGIWTYSLVDPWETHYAEVSRRMLQDHDWVHTDWQNEGFRSKPVLTFWLMAASMKAVDVGDDGGYAGEMTASARTMLAIRLPFVMFGVMGLVMTWFMLARLVSRRMAWLGLLVLGTTPFYVLVARQGITDMTLVACMIGAVAMFVLAEEDGERPIEPLGRLRLPRALVRSGGFVIDPRHVLWLVAGGFVLIQAIYYAYYFTIAPQLWGRLRFPVPAIVIPAFMVLCLVLQWSPVLTYLVNGVVDLLNYPFRGRVPHWRGLQPIRHMRQVYMLWFYTLLAVSLLGKGLPALGIIGIVNLCYVALLGRWRDIVFGRYELLRGIVLMIAIAVPWHIAMFLKEGPLFFREYFVQHLWNRAAVGVFGERGTFNFYLGQIGYGMWIWAALLPAALIAFLRTTNVTTREGRIRFVVGAWGIATVAFFSLVQTKFHHYILPAVPALCLVVAFWLDDVWARRTPVRLPLILLGIGIVFILTRDMMFEEKQWIEMFVFRYDRPWPNAEPWAIDASDGFFGLGILAAAAIAILAIVRHKWIGIAALGTAALACALWAMHVYMPIAGTHWGMREAMASYYQEREIHGQRLVYFGGRQLADDWAPVLDGAKGKPVRWSFDTVIPDKLQVGQPMTIRIQVNKIREERITESEVSLVGPVVAIGDHSVTVELSGPDVGKLAAMVNAGRNAPRAPKKPVRVVDGDRLIVWQGYWRGEVFWSANEVYGWLPEMQTDWQLGDSDSKKLLKYLGDRTLAPLGRRYFVISAGSLTGLRPLLPGRGKDTFEVLDTTSNKFSLGAFYL